MLDNGEIQLTTQDERLAHDAVIENGLPVVGYGNRARALQSAEIREHGALATARGSGNRKDVDHAPAFGLSKPFHPVERIHDRNRVGHGANGSEAPSGGGGGSGRNRLFVL